VPPVRFTAGDSVRSTQKIVTQKGKPAEPPRRSRSGLSPQNTMNGAPGQIDTGQDSSGKKFLRGGPPRGARSAMPRREGAIGRRGGSGARTMGSAAKAPGSADKSYKATSTGTAKGFKSTGGYIGGPPTSSGGSGGPKGPPTSMGKIPGGGKNGGPGSKLYNRSSPRAVPARGGRGTMEALAGKASRGKSRMY
jgi:hypothetical protein